MPLDHTGHTDYSDNFHPVALNCLVLTLQWGVISPTMDSATSWTMAILIHLLESTPQSPATSPIMPMRYMWSAGDGLSSVEGLVLQRAT